MITKVVISICLLGCLLPCARVASGQSQGLKIDPPQNIQARFRLFKTENIWTQLLLDTRNGRVWQVTFSVSKDSESVRLPINLEPLAETATSKDGRFTLYPTENVWTFLLLDQGNGNVWQCQYSMADEDHRFIQPILSPKPSSK